MNDNKQAVVAIDDETRAHQERTSKLRFKQNMVHGIGAATVFGLVAAGGAALLKVASFTGFMGVAATVGIAALAIVGVGCLYFSSKYTSQLVNLEQTRHATQIAKGINNVGQGVDKPITFPAQNNAQAVAQAPEKPAADLSVSKPTLVVDNVMNLGRTALPAPETARGQG